MEYISQIKEELFEIGMKVLKIYNTDFSHELKQDKSPLTQADMLAHNELMKLLKNKFPKYGIISEECENEEDLDNKEFIFVIDPIDGTKDFIQKTNEFSIMIGLIDKNRQPIFGVVYSPALDEIVWAQKNQGAFLEKSGIQSQLIVSSIANFENITLVRSRNHFSKFDELICKSLNISKTKKCGSVGVKFCEIAKGNAELCYYTNSKMGIWDDCAPQIILEEAGGEVFDINGGYPKYNIHERKMKFGFVGTNGRVSKNKIVEIIQKNL